MTVLNQSKNIEKKFIYLMNVGVLIAITGLFSVLGGSNFKNNSPETPFAIFSFGLVAIVPYLHVMFINNFFIRTTPNKYIQQDADKRYRLKSVVVS